MKPTDLDEALVRKIFEDLSEATTKGYGKSLHNYNRNAERKLQLQQNVFKFSAAKAYQEQAWLNFLLKDENGNPRTAEEFMKEALKMNLQFNNHYLRTEVQTFQRSSAQAAKWAKYESQKDVYPNLQYKTANDKRVRKDHDEIADTIKAIDDAFWDKWYPPNGWNCRCYVIQTTKAADTRKAPGNPTMGFDNNVGKTGQPVDPEHPYYIFPEKEAVKIRKSFEGLKLKMPMYQTIFKKGKNKLETSIWKDSVDYKDGFESGRIAVRELGIDIKIRPHINPRVLPEVKNPEYEIFGELSDLKSKFKKNNYNGITNGFVSAKKQGCRIVVFNLTNSFKKLDILKAYRKFNSAMSHKNNDYDSIIAIYEEKAVLLKRKDFLENKALEKLEKLKADL